MLLLKSLLFTQKLVLLIEQVKHSKRKCLWQCVPSYTMWQNSTFYSILFLSWHYCLLTLLLGPYYDDLVHEGTFLRSKATALCFLKGNLCCIFENSQFINRTHSIAELLEETFEENSFYQDDLCSYVCQHNFGYKSYATQAFDILDHFAFNSLPCTCTASKY